PVRKGKILDSFSLIEYVILSAGAILISPVYFHFICPEGFSLIERVILSAGAMLIFSGEKISLKFLITHVLLQNCAAYSF
ncbi:hypothetical protein N7491_006184, partial [Penicillium cf. griseofulvum]